MLKPRYAAAEARSDLSGHQRCNTFRGLLFWVGFGLEFEVDRVGFYSFAGAGSAHERALAATKPTEKPFSRSSSR